jgi:glycosyltransferase involved in cell wall biosynthesis
MRIWVFPSFYPSPLKGRAWNGIFTHRQNKALQEQGVEVKVVQPVLYKWPWPLDRFFPCYSDQHHRSLPRKRTYDGVEIFHPIIEDPRPHRLFPSSYSDLYLKSVMNWVKEEGIQFTHDDFFLAQYVPEAGMVLHVGKKLGVRTGVMVIGDDVWVEPNRNPGMRQFFIETMMNADVRFSVSESLANETRSICNQWLDFAIVRRGVNHQTFHPVSSEEKIIVRQNLELPVSATLMIVVGTLIDRKGWFEVLDAFANAVKKDQNLRLIAVHAGETNISMQEEVEKREIQDYVIDVAQVSPHQIHQYYQAADFFCLASHWEGISNAVTEAMASGLAVITTNIPGHLELITHEENGLLVPVKDPAAIEEAILRLSQNETLRNQLGSNARQFILQQWGDYQFNSRKIIEAFGGLVHA